MAPRLWDSKQAGLVTMGAAIDMRSWLTVASVIEQAFECYIVEKHHHGPAARFQKEDRDSAAEQGVTAHLTRLKRQTVQCRRCGRHNELEVVGGADVAAAVSMVRLAKKPHIHYIIACTHDPLSLMTCFKLLSKLGKTVIVPTQDPDTKQQLKTLDNVVLYEYGGQPQLPHPTSSVVGDLAVLATLKSQFSNIPEHLIEDAFSQVGSNPDAVRDYLTKSA